MTDATGTTTFTYTARNEPLTRQVPSGKVITYTYDQAGRRTLVQDYQGGRFTHSYDAKNQEATITNPQGKVTTMAYDPLGRVTLTTYGNGVKEEFS